MTNLEISSLYHLTKVASPRGGMKSKPSASAFPETMIIPDSPPLVPPIAFVPPMTVVPPAPGQQPGACRQGWAQVAPQAMAFGPPPSDTEAMAFGPPPSELGPPHCMPKPTPKPPQGPPPQQLLWTPPSSKFIPWKGPPIAKAQPQQVQNLVSSSQLSSHSYMASTSQFSNNGRIGVEIPQNLYPQDVQCLCPLFMTRRRKVS